MKLQYKINIRFLAFSVIIFMAAGFLFYNLLGRIVHQNVDEMLLSRKKNILTYLDCHSFPDSTYQSPDKAFTIQLFHGPSLMQWTDTLIYDENDREIIPFRKLSFTTTTNENTYKVVIIQSLLESDDLIKAVFYFMLALFVVLVVVLFVVNYRLSLFIWNPFFYTMQTLKLFKPGNAQELHFAKTNTFEFDVLNETLNDLTKKIQADFVNLKEFTENASHEIQTPLAIIKSKLEMSLHDPLLPENQRTHIHIAYESVIKLSKLNEALLLLSKIENHQFVEDSIIDLSDLVKERIIQVEDLTGFRNIKVTLDLDAHFKVTMNRYLAEILVNNLLGNAIKHNVNYGEIRISGGKHELSISNTGLPLTIEPEKLFKRFVKQSTTNESTGLGLAIAHEICLTHHLCLQYSCQNGFHTLTLFNNS